MNSTWQRATQLKKAPTFVLNKQVKRPLVFNSAAKVIPRKSNGSCVKLDHEMR